MRSELSMSWTKAVQQVVKNYNQIPRKNLGYLTPASIISRSDDIKIREARKRLNMKPEKSEPHYYEALENQKKYEADKSNIQVGKYVSTLFSK